MTAGPGAAPIRPCVRLGGRYRLDQRIRTSTGWSSWQAFDETLARAVTILVFAQGYPRTANAVAAACAASRVSDARLARVFDVAEDWDHTYLVLEWVAGHSLQDLLARGPLDPGRGAEIIAQAAEALAAAHAARVAHLCLTPKSLCWTPAGGVKIVGLGIDAALCAATAADPVTADTRGLGRLLYATLTAHWPGTDWPALPAAPREVDGRSRSPRLVRDGVPAELDDVACQILFRRPAAGPGQLGTPAGLAAVLNRLIPAPVVPPPVRPIYHAIPAMPGRGAAASRMWAIAGVLGLAAMGATAWQVSRGGAEPSAVAAAHQPAMAHHPASGGPPVRVLWPAGAAAFGANGGDNPDQAVLALGGRPGAGWTTGSYLGTPYLASRYGGTGLVLDMGRRVRVSSVAVTFGQVPGAHARVEVGGAGPVPAGFTTLGRTSNASGTVGFTGRRAVPGRYVLVWFTKLAPEPGQAGRYRAGVFNVVVRGRS